MEHVVWNSSLQRKRLKQLGFMVDPIKHLYIHAIMIYIYIYIYIQLKRQYQTCPPSGESFQVFSFKVQPKLCSAFMVKKQHVQLLFYRCFRHAKIFFLFFFLAHHQRLFHFAFRCYMKKWSKLFKKGTDKTVLRKI